MAEDIKTSTNLGLTAAKAARKDEFYTQYADIEKEIESYLGYNPQLFAGKIIYCNCDNPFESNFFKYFAANFKRLGMRKLITTNYDGSSIAWRQPTIDDYEKGNSEREKLKAVCVEMEEVIDIKGDGAGVIDDVKLFLERNSHSYTPLKGGGNLLSDECIEFLRESDIVVMNPPFYLFHDFVELLVDHKKKFLIIGNINAITYKGIFPLIKSNLLWLGCTNFNAGMFLKSQMIGRNITILIGRLERKLGEFPPRVGIQT